MLDMVDEGRIPMRPAVELSYIPQEQQEALRNFIKAEDRVPSHVQAVKMRKLADEGCLTNDAVASIMREEASVKVEPLKIPRERIQRFFPVDTSAQAIEETIIEALELWHKNQ